MAFEPSDVRYWMGEEVHLFIFRRQGITLRYASSTRDVVVGEHTYLAAQIERDAIRQTAERAKDILKIRIAYLLDPGADEYPVTQPLGDWWRPYIPSDEITVICLSYDPSGMEPPSVEWMGTVAGPGYTDTRMELSCDPNGGHGNAANQGPKAQRACFKAVYSKGIRGCNLPDDGYMVSATLTGIAGEELEAAEFASPKRTFVGGRVEWADAIDPEVTHRRAIVAHTGTTLTIADDAGDLAAAHEVTAYTAGFWVHGEVAEGGVDGLTLTVPEFIGTEFSLNGGTLYWDRADGIREERPIMGHNPATGAVTILWGGAEIAEGLAVSALPNCPGTWAACAARRPDPEMHYGGSVYKPVRDPILEGVSMSWG